MFMTHHDISKADWESGSVCATIRVHTSAYATTQPGYDPIIM